MKVRKLEIGCLRNRNNHDAKGEVQYQLKTGPGNEKERFRVLIPFAQKSDARQQVTNHIVAEVV
jgi:hypothetical protein